MIFGVLIWLLVIEITLLKIENEIIQTFRMRIEQQEEFNTLLDHLEESIFILSESKIEFVNDKCLELLNPLIKNFSS